MKAYSCIIQARLILQVAGESITRSQTAMTIYMPSLLERWQLLILREQGKNAMHFRGTREKVPHRKASLILLDAIRGSCMSFLH